MISLGLSVADQILFENLLRKHHQVNTVVRVLDLNHAALGDVSDRLLAGQVNLDITAEVSRSATLDLFDPQSDLGFDINNPAKGAVFLDKMLQIHYCIAAPGSSTWYNVPVFTGPLNKVQRVGPLLKVEAQGKEIMSRQGLRWSLTYAQRRRKDSVIRDLLEYTGETKFALASSGATLTKPLVLTRANNPWSTARSLADSLGMYLFYDGRGVATMRPKSGASRFVFDGSVVLKKPEPGYDLAGLINTVLVIGGGKTKPRWVVAPNTHPLSPYSLRRNGKPRYFVAEINDSSLTTAAAQDAAGRASLNSGLLQSVDIAFDSLPVPHLEEYDGYTYKEPAYALGASVRTMSLPLTSSGSMSMGALRRVTPQTYRFQKR